MVLYCTLSFAKLANSCNASLTYPEFFWADQYIHETHESTTVVGAGGRGFSKFVPLDGVTRSRVNYSRRRSSKH